MQEESLFPEYESTHALLTKNDKPSSYHFSATNLIYSIKHKHKCKIPFVIGLKFYS